MTTTTADDSNTMANLPNEPLINIERFRSPNENDRQWMYRKLFIETYWNEYNEERLLCLSQCYMNTKCLGCKYMDPLKSLLEQLEKKVNLPSMNSDVSSNGSQKITESHSGKSKTPVPDEKTSL
ncbi:unnamed protein product [Didymodactylos carnosus]|uniref:XRN2-binding (XTBD) domain-containing protein n=1 Tax=Didymodactylos carnosus TaxID=1234261 RepID=A0A8S2SY50_9BILA|nr:unnamed protein product [Didymodactylos carnosus]CAF4255438.1 unnamed protein product [Didymodactylos carnosus]